MIESVRLTVELYHRDIVRKLSLDYELSLCTVNQILTKDLGTSKHCARWVTRILTKEHKMRRVECAKQFVRTFRTHPSYIKSIVTTGESWVSFTRPKTKVFFWHLGDGCRNASQGIKSTVLFCVVKRRKFNQRLLKNGKRICPNRLEGYQAKDVFN
ncbi:unnamed protein product [Lepeophtheirus salmonis]|uniref:(salmon louse) hypothetical protein n=1 Tax=Lepeophtheirus salmonis TaxID=72036 RepID=A0A7R8CNS1_LEPSM|nr:unnamed protein product [Lepeophtheirus salmonis]CAF2832353.1 unnamed protein product [Lepeophtheirus salmonis]